MYVQSSLIHYYEIKCTNVTCNHRVDNDIATIASDVHLANMRLLLCRLVINAVLRRFLETARDIVMNVTIIVNY